MTSYARGLQAWLAAALLATVAAPAAATTWYVRAGGDDGNDGLSPATALASIRPAARRLREPGDRLIVGPGTYREGNISPFGNGTPEAPMVVFGDASGAMTGDPPGPVLILPPNAPASTSGFLIRGRSDVVIEGFEIAGTRDAAIDVRHRSRTGADSTRIALRNNRVRASRLGMRIIAAGPVEVSGNHLIGTRDDPAQGVGDGLLLRSGESGPLQATVVGNRIDDCFMGILGGGGDALIASNELRSRGRNFKLFTNGTLIVTGNHLRGPYRGGEIYAGELTAADNVVDATVSLGASRALTVEHNTFGSRAAIHGAAAHGRVADNTVGGDLFVGVSGEVEVRDNSGRKLVGKGIGALLASGNRFDELIKVRIGGEATVEHNQTGAMLIRAAAATVADNSVGHALRIVADDATVSGNAAAALSVQRRRHPDAPVRSPEAFVIRDNTLGGALSASGAATVLLQGNAADGSLRAVARDGIDAIDNRARGIATSTSAAGSRVMVKDNRSRGALGPGLMVVGAEQATIDGNVAADSAGAGLVVRRVADLVVTANELRNNRQGGASIRVPPVGDCNENNDVTIGELLIGVGVTLQRTARHRCDAADANRDRRVTVDEVVLAVGAALGRPDPLASRVELRDNVVEDNPRRGLDVYARATLVATGNRILRNAGIPLAVHGRLPLSEALVAGNVLGGGSAEGLLIQAVERSVVRDNVVFDNRDAGILLRAAPSAAITNNLVYANGGPGIAAGLGIGPDDATQIDRNTIFGNGGWGLVLGQRQVPTTAVAVRDNIIDQNVRGGLAAVEDAVAGLTVERNVNTGGYGNGVPPGADDFDADPLFVDPDGADGILGGDGYADDDFRLQPGSPASDGIGFRYPEG